MKSLPALLLVLLSTAALAEDKAKLVSILPFDATRTRLDEANKTALEESIRTEAGDILGDFGLTVLTSDTQLKILTDNGIDPNRACEAACHLEAARELNARYFISGIVTAEGDGLLAFIRLFDSATGRQLSSAQLEGGSVRDLRKSFQVQARAFFAKAGFGTAPAPPAPAGATVGVPRSEEAQRIAERSETAHKALSRHEAGEATEPPAPPPAMPPPVPGPATLGPEKQLTPPTGVHTPVRAIPRAWQRWFVSLSYPSFIGKEWGNGNWAFRFGFIALSGRWYQAPLDNGWYIEIGIPTGFGYQWHINGVSAFSIGIPNVVEFDF